MRPRVRELAFTLLLLAGCVSNRVDRAPLSWPQQQALLSELREYGLDGRVGVRVGEEGWQANGGFVYTVDWQGRPVVADRYFWEPAEAVGAACYLARATGEQRYLDWYERVWRYTDEHVIDHRSGSWHPELDADNRPIQVTWLGKPDVYHAYQAMLLPRLGEVSSFVDGARRLIS